MRPTAANPTMHGRNRPRSTRWLFALALITAYMIGGVAVAILMSRQVRQNVTHWYGDLMTKVTLHAEIMDTAVSCRLREMAVLTHVRAVQQFASHDPLALAWPGPGPSTRDRLTSLLNEACGELGLTGATVFDGDMQPMLSVGAGPTGVPDLASHVALAQQQQKAVFVDVFPDQQHRRVAYVAPVFLDDETAVGALVATEDPAILLYAIARASEGDNATMHSAVQRKIVRGGQPAVEVLWSDSTVLSRADPTPYESATAIDRAAADSRTWVGSFVGADGVERFGATAPVPSTGWGLVVTVEAAEALAEVRTLGWLEMGLVAIAVPLVLSFVMLQAERSKRLALEATSRRVAQANVEVGRLNRIMRATRDVNQYISHHSDIQEVLDKACESVLSIGDFQTSWIAVRDGESIAVVAKAGNVEKVPKTVTAISMLERGRPCVYQALKTGEPVLVTPADRSICSVCDHRDDCPSSEVFVGPLLAQGEVLGVLVINSLTVWSVGSNEKEALIELAEDIAFAIVSQRFRNQKELAEAALRQSEKMETVGELAGGIAHDFNNLLTGIIGNVDLALANTRDDPAVAQPLRDAGTAARRAADLTAKLLTFSRKAVINPAVVGMDHVIRETLALLARSMPATIAIRHVEHEGTWPVVADATQMIQVFLNLAINARDAMHGAGTLVIEASNTVIDADYVAEHSYAQPGDFVVVTVSDTGAGMTDDVKKHVFEPFFTTKPVGEGTGLGLSMVFGAVKQAGGWVDIQSTVGVGTSVLVYLPRSHRDQGMGGQEQAERPATYGGAETVLVIDDEEVVRAVAQRVLERAGYTVLVAGDCNEGLAVFQGHPDGIDVIILDLTMPGMSPQEFLQRIHDLDPRVAVILSSGYASTDSFQELLARFPAESGAFLAKPYLPEQLLAVVRDVLAPGHPGTG